MAKTCAMCGQPSVTMHVLMLLGTEKQWDICCLCTAEMTSRLNRAGVSSA